MVVIVVYLLLQDWRETKRYSAARRACLLVGTLCSFPRSDLLDQYASMFGMVLAIGLVGRRHRSWEGLHTTSRKVLAERRGSPKRMDELIRPVSVSPVLSSVFVPTASSGNPREGSINNLR